jgi:hypothetical protein
MSQQTEETWSTHQMSLTLSNIDEVYFEAREHAQSDPTGDELRRWVATWFRGDLRHLSNTNQGAITWLRDNMSEAEWREIDWKSVAEDLAAE